MAPILPDASQFPYTIRVVSDILESNGSSSMASVCGATLSLMDAGVPISDPVGGISIGLVQDASSGRHTLLTDIIGDEDHFGDMDFKVAGTQRGVTGIQLDLKNRGITEVIVRETLEQAREARLEILRAMLRAIKRPREEISANAPRLIQIQINPEKIGLIIGPGGKTIRRLQEETGAKIDIDDTGVVTLSSLEAAGAEAARDKIVAMTEGVQLGRIYEGRVTSIKEFGAFVEILPGKDGLVHISELSEGYVSAVTDVCRVGDPMLVKAIAIDDQDRVKLSRKAAMAERGQVDEIATRPRPPGPQGGEGRGGDRGGPPPRRPSGGDRGPDRDRGGYGGGDRDRDRGGYGGEGTAVLGGPEWPGLCALPRCAQFPLQVGKLKTGQVSQGGPRRKTGIPARGESSRGESIDHHSFTKPGRSQVGLPRAGEVGIGASRDEAPEAETGAGLMTEASGARPVDSEQDSTRRLRVNTRKSRSLLGGWRTRSATPCRRSR